MERDEWLETKTGNRVSKNSRITCAEKITIVGNSTVGPFVTLKGDVDLVDKKQTSILIGKYVYLESHCSIIPPDVSANNGECLCMPVQVGAFTVVGSGTKISLTMIGNRVYIGSNCTLGNQSAVYDCCWVHDGTIIPPRFVIPPLSEVSGKPGVDFLVKPLNPSYKKLIERLAREKQIIG